MHRELYGELANHPIIPCETCLIFGFTIREMETVNEYFGCQQRVAGRVGIALPLMIWTVLMLLIVRITPFTSYSAVAAAIARPRSTQSWVSSWLIMLS